MKDTAKSNMDSSEVKQGQTDNSGRYLALSALNTTASGDPRLRATLLGQRILGKRPAPMTEVADKATARADRNSRDHELLDTYASAQEQSDFLEPKRRRTSAITILGNDQL